MENFKFKKEFGQNFIFDENLLSSIVFDAEVCLNDEVLEIGAGAGTLTKKLCEKAKKVVSYEIDKKLTEKLEQVKKQNKNLEVFMRDALKEPISLIEENFSKPYKIVANLPYYITSPLIFKFLEQSQNVVSLTVMVQKEVALRFTSKQGSKDYGVSTIMLSSMADVSYLRDFPKEVFTPSPKVDSALIKIVPNKNKRQANNKDVFAKVVKASFLMRRKTLVNNLLTLSISKDIICQALLKINKTQTTRAEQLSLDEFIELSNLLEKEIN